MGGIHSVDGGINSPGAENCFLHFELEEQTRGAFYGREFVLHQVKTRVVVEEQRLLKMRSLSTSVCRGK